MLDSASDSPYGPKNEHPAAKHILVRLTPLSTSMRGTSGSAIVDHVARNKVDEMVRSKLAGLGEGGVVGQRRATVRDNSTPGLIAEARFPFWRLTNRRRSEALLV